MIYNKYIMNILLIVLSVLGIISTTILIGVIIYFTSKKIIKAEEEHKSMVIFADAKTSMDENVLIYIVDHVKLFKEEGYWDADFNDVRLYAGGKQISCRAFKSATIPNGIKLMITGVTDSFEDLLSVIGAVKFGIWEISFDSGATRVPLLQINDPVQQYEAEKIAMKRGWTNTNRDHKTRQEILKEARKSVRHKLTKGALPNHGLVAHINESKSTGTSLRYQILIPKSNTQILSMAEANPEIISFYHIYEGHAYKMESVFVDRVGSLWEYDILGLKPGQIYVGFSTSIDGGKHLLPSSALFGITRNQKGEVPTIDEAILAKPEDYNAKKYEIWNEQIGLQYLGPEYIEKAYSIIVKKHYEDEYSEEYLSLSRTKPFFAEYSWLKGSDETRDEHIEIVAKASDSTYRKSSGAKKDPNRAEKEKKK